MSDHLGANDASTAALDAADEKQERIAAAYWLAHVAALDQIGMLVESLADDVQPTAVAHNGSRYWAAIMRAIDTGASVRLAMESMTPENLLRMTAPNFEPQYRLAAMDEIWRRHMAGMSGWIDTEAEK